MQHSLLFTTTLLSVVGIVFFVFGFWVGCATKRSHQYTTKTHQHVGEAIVHQTLVANFSPPHYHLLNNITLPYRDGTTQIDHIMVSTKGIFVIETKHYAGLIYGDETLKQWLQVVYSVKSRFQNPIHQNFLHVKVIQQLFSFLPRDYIHSVVVFTGSGQFKTPIPHGVMYLDQLVAFVNNFQDEIISANRVEFCVGRLECRRYEVTKKTDLQHRAYLAEKFGTTED